MGLKQPLFEFGSRAITSLILRKINHSLSCQNLERLSKFHPLNFHNEGEHVAPLIR